MASAPEAASGELAEAPVARRRDLTALEVLRRLETSPRGLVESQAQMRLAQYGENSVAVRRPIPWLRRFLRSLRDPFTMVLLCLGLLSAVVSSWAAVCVITALVTVSCALRSAGEHRADRAAAALRELVAATATVMRRASESAPALSREIPVEELVPGDVVRLVAGDMVPADLRLLRACGLTVHQSALTGESAPVAKRALDVPEDPAVSPEGATGPSHLCFQGSSVATGSGTAVVVATGADTYFAKAQRALAHDRPATAFDRAVTGVSWTLIRFMLLAAPLVLVTHALLRGHGLETLPFAVAVAVALTPEMLPVVVTAALARGAVTLARAAPDGRRVIVRRLPALHDLGAVEVLCTDKTGTLTQDRPVFDCSFAPDGRPDPEPLGWAAVNSLWTLQLADLPAPDALDEAILAAGDEAGGGAENGTGGPYDALVGVAVLPFDPVRRLATAVVRDPARLGVHILVVKGAVEEVLARCDLDDAERARLARLAESRAADGLRLVAVATAERPARSGSYTPADEHRLTLRGFVGLSDTVVPSAADALTAFADSGVNVKVLTGDHPGTATRVCRELGLTAPAEAVLTADLIDALDDAELARVAENTVVFARCTPAHKARVVRALRADGRTTGFLGDGINDLPALHAADVAICPVGAADTVRESADLVLADKDLTAVHAGVATGRRTTGNIATYLCVVLSSNLGNVLAMLAVGLLLPFLPMLPVQVLAQNLCFDAAQLAFAFDRPARALQRRPVRLRPKVFTRAVTCYGLLNAAADLATFAVLALTVPASTQPDGQAVFHAGWFTENLLTQAMVILVLRTGRRAVEGPLPGPVRFATTALAVIGVLLPLSPLAPALGLTALPALYYVLLAAVLVLYGVGLAAAKAYFDRVQGLAGS